MKRDESLYNLAQENEVFVFLDFLPKAVDAVLCKHSTIDAKKDGRPPKNMRDILICLAIQRYIGFSTRRSIGIIELFNKFARLRVDVPCFKTLCTYRKDPRVNRYLDEIIEITSKPASVIETNFSTDATGASTSCFSSWFSLRTGRKIKKREHIMSHVTTSNILNMAVAVDVSVNYGKDSKFLREHVTKVRKNFNIDDWCGDSLYLSRENCNVVASVGGTPWFKPKKNTTPKPCGSPAWKQMINAFDKTPEKAFHRYHKRSQSETTFSAKKRKFGNFVRSKNDEAKENEEKLGWVAYNFSVLSRAIHEFSISPQFW
jgi:transposase